jgi:propionyl-CoA carboxylase alpha chain
MGKQACQLALAVGYRTAGTVEFLLDSSNNFYFLEMNTRLQVEHPVSELITGIDLVKEMLRTAAGHELTIKQEDIGIHGWAIECRVYAEDVYKAGFGLPSIGRLSRYSEPNDQPGVRCDSGIRQGSEISMYYDPMISKLITYGSDRNDAIKKMTNALDNYVIRGVTHNVPLCHEVLRDEQFIGGDITTNYLYEKYPEGFKGLQLSEGAEQAKLASMFAALFAARQMSHNQAPLSKTPKSYNLSVNVSEFSTFNCKVSVSCEGYSVSVNGEHEFTISSDFAVDDVIQSMNFGSEDVHTIQTIDNSSSGDMIIQHLGTLFKAKVLPSNVADYLSVIPEKEKPDETRLVRSPMPGTVISVNVAVGDVVAQGSEVAVLEAMKMQNSLTAPRDGTIVAVHISAGDKSADGDVLVEFE